MTAPQLATFGLWPALPLTGYLLWRRSASFGPASTSFAVATTVGLGVWSLPLLFSMEMGVYHGSLVGIVGWLVTLIGLLVLWRRREAIHHVRLHGSRWDLALLGGLALAGVLYLGWPSENVLPMHDEGMYVNHAVYAAKHGSFHPPYPWPSDADSIFLHTSTRFPGMFKVDGSYTFYFGHLFQAWLAHAYSSFGIGGVFRFNGIVGLMAALVFYGICRRATSRPVAVVAALVLAFNTSQLWLARNSLSEMLTQLLLWTGMLLLVQALGDEDRAAAAWVGVLFGLSAFVRVDSLLMLPLLFVSQLASRVVEPPDKRLTRVWLSLHATAVPGFTLALLYYPLFSRPYFDIHLPLIKPIGVVTLVAFGLLLVGSTRVTDWLRPWLTSRPLMIVFGFAALGIALYAYFIRPVTTAPIFGPSTYLEGRRSYAEDSLVNLALYLSFPVVWAGLFGFYLALWMTVRRRSPILMPILVLVSGLTVLYLYNPTITPRHFWAIRRFIPVVIPGFVFFAALFTGWMAHKLTFRPRVALGALSILFLSTFIGRQNSLIWNFAEQEGTYSQLQALAAKLPEDEVVLAFGNNVQLRTWPAPLYLIFDRRVVPLNIATPRGRRAAEAWIRRQSRATGTPVTVLANHNFRSSTLQVRKREDVVLTRAYSEWTEEPPPDEIVHGRSVVRVYSIQERPRSALPATETHSAPR